MVKSRWFNFVVAAVLLALAALTIHQLAASAQVISANTSQAAVSRTENLQNPFECPFTTEQIRSIYPDNASEVGNTIPFTKDGPTGVEGGMYMLRYCRTP